nr:PREDICTED: leucine-rich repeat-containing protein 14B-like [Latimeria chalumnae]|eukprot:XP_006013909.2 PREDICTED: leucine-rich repeat-containing protein 14B-like [Latimeria chalumnae]
MQRSEVDPSVFSTSIDVLINLFVTDRSYDLAVQTLLMRCHCPLKIRCVAFRADSLALRKLFYIIKLVQPESLQKLEVVHNIHLKMEHLEILLHNVSFPELRSLALPIRTFDVTRLTTESEPVLAHIGEMLSRMTQLREISLPFSILTGRIRRLLSPLKTPLKVLDVTNCSLNHIDMAYLANSLHSEHLEVLDLSGHSVAELFPSTFFKLLNHASHTLRSLTLEDCNITDSHINMMILGLVPCRKLEEFKFLGNPLSSRALKCLFSIFTDFPRMRYIEYPVPRDCYPQDIAYPLDETSLTSYDPNRFEQIKEELYLILLQANRGDIVASTPLFGAYDPDIQETNRELGAFMMQSFKDALSNFMTALQNST